MTENSQDAMRPLHFGGTAASVSIRVTSSDLFQGQREVVIVHRDQEYRLTITKADKLILTK